MWKKNWRTTTVLAVFFLIGAAVISRLFYLQVLNHKLYQAHALGQQAGFQEIKGARGNIFCANSQDSKGASGNEEIKSMAINRDLWTLSASVKEIENKELFAEKLSSYFGEPKDFVLSKLENDSYAVLKKDISAEQLAEIKNMKLKGLYWQKSSYRYYPQEKLASQVVGFVGGNEEGQYGLEGFYEEIVKGKTGILEDKRGITTDEAQISLDGSNLYLTIDCNIQFEAESLLKKAKEKIDIQSGQIIVIKPDSGRVVAMANYPLFDLNQYSKEQSMEIFQNSAVQKLFEPGSIMKPFTMAISLNEGKIGPDDTFTDAGFIKIGKDVIYNFDHQKYGQRTMSGILEKSINTGAVYVSQLVSHDTFFDYMKKFGFTEKTGIDLQGEVSSRNEELRKGSQMQYATASFGQGIELTPIQIVRGFCAIANGGKLIKPYVVEKITHDQDEVPTNPQISNPVISEKTATEVTKMMVNVVEKGFGDQAKIQGYYIAGKTGTAEVAIENGKGYYSDRTIQSFIGFAPAYNPQFLILVKLDNPKVPKSSLSAAPIFKDLAQYIINYWHIPPDYETAE